MWAYDPALLGMEHKQAYRHIMAKVIPASRACIVLFVKGLPEESSKRNAFVEYAETRAPDTSSRVSGLVLFANFGLQWCTRNQAPCFPARSPCNFDLHGYSPWGIEGACVSES